MVRDALPVDVPAAVQLKDEALPEALIQSLGQKDS